MVVSSVSEQTERIEIEDAWQGWGIRQDALATQSIYHRGERDNLPSKCNDVEAADGGCGPCARRRWGPVQAGVRQARRPWTGHDGGGC